MDVGRRVPAEDDAVSEVSEADVGNAAYALFRFGACALQIVKDTIV